MCGLKSTSVVCLSILHAYLFLIDSYRPYQLRNNNLAVAFDGAHGQAAQARVEMAVLQNATATSPTALAGARGALRRGTKTSEPAGGRRADRRIREALPRRFITERVCVSQLASCHAPLHPRPPTQNVDYGACASVSWPCMCVSARFEGLLQSVCV